MRRDARRYRSIDNLLHFAVQASGVHALGVRGGREAQAHTSTKMHLLETTSAACDALDCCATAQCADSESDCLKGRAHSCPAAATGSDACTNTRKKEVNWMADKHDGPDDQARMLRLDLCDQGEIQVLCP